MTTLQQPPDLPLPNTPSSGRHHEADVAACTQTLERLAADPTLFEQLGEATRVALLVAAGRLSRPTRIEARSRDRVLRKARRQALLAERTEANRQARSTTGIRQARQAAVFTAPARQLPQAPAASGSGESHPSPATGPSDTARAAGPRRLASPRHCYVCKGEYDVVHFFYDAMCTACGDFNYDKRFQTASLDGRVAVITGARLKIGYQASLMMLRSGAKVIVTTRFPRDAAFRYAREPDFGDWSQRLRVYGLDLRHIPSVESFVRHISATEDRLDILINNAAQTVRRPPAFYAHLRGPEQLEHAELPHPVRGLLEEFESFEADKSAEPARLALEAERAPRADLYSQLFPVGRLDADLQQVDLRTHNSWRMKLSEVPAAELVEVQLINSVAPFILCSQFKPLFERSPAEAKHVVNVSAMEGVFSRGTKTDKHPHTNMAKAALNMLTLTSAPDYAKSGIYMNAVDTGWVTDEDPAAISARKQAEHDFQPPLDIVDGAARVCDPFFSGLRTGQHLWGKFLKDYSPAPW